MTEEPLYDEETLEAARVLFARQASFLMGAVSIDGLPDGDLPEVAFAGRSNVGKSSLINALVGHKHLARASNEPGRTRDEPAEARTARCTSPSSIPSMRASSRA